MVPVGYTFRDQYPAIYQIDRAEVSTMEVWQDGALVAPSSATLSLYSPTGELLSSPAVSIVGDIATATIPAQSDLGEGYRESWILTVNGTEYVKFRDAAVCRSPLRLPLTDADLTSLYPDLAQNLNSSAVSFQTFIDAAWSRILRKLRSSGDMPYIVVQASAFYDALQHLSLHLVYRWWYGQTGGDHLLAQADYHWGQYEHEWSAISYETDRDQDGTSDDRDRESASKSAIVYPNAAPSRYRNKRRRW